MLEGLADYFIIWIIALTIRMYNRSSCSYKVITPERKEFVAQRKSQSSMGTFKAFEYKTLVFFAFGSPLAASQSARTHRPAHEDSSR